MTTSANIGTIMMPLAMVARGRVYHVDELKPKKKKKKKKKLYYGEIGMLPVTIGESNTKAER